jgi:hypothetical protein
VKVLISFISGIMICCAVLFSAKTVIPILASTDNEGESSENVSESLLDLIPDIEMIYRESLTKPFVKAESKIYDEDIAEFYRELLDDTGLR